MKAGIWALGGTSLLTFALSVSCGQARSGRDSSGEETQQAGGAGAAGAESKIDAGGPEALPAMLSERSFAVTARVELSDSADGGLLDGCTSFDFTARFSQDADAGWRLVAAVSGEQASARLETAGTRYRAAAVSEPQPPSFEDEPAVLDLPAGDCCERLRLRDLLLSPELDATDGSVAGFSASGTGIADSSACGGDYFERSDVRVTLRAGRDQQAPRALLPTSRLHPFDPIEIPFSEVIGGEVRARLVDDEGVALSLERTGFQVAGGPFWGFHAAPLMSFGRSAQLEIEGDDLAGNAFTGGGAVVSQDDPGILAPDGFETDVNALSKGPLELVTAGAISGARSLRTGGESTARVTFHLRSAEPARLVRFRAQYLDWLRDDGDDDVVGVRVRAAALGVDGIVSSDIPTQSPPIRGDFPDVPPPQEAELELPESTRDAIVTFEIAPHDEACGLISCDEIPMLIDDLRLE